MQPGQHTVTSSNEGTSLTSATCETSFQVMEQE